MQLNQDNIRQNYDRLASGVSSPWEVYASEESLAMAKEHQIPEENWNEHRVRMQLGQEMIEEEMNKGVPQTPEEAQSRIRGMISNLINSRMRELDNDVARRGMLIQALRAGGYEEDDDARLEQFDTNTLQRMLVDATYDLTITKVLPVLQQQCQMLMTEPDAEKKILDNPGALAVPMYLACPQMQDKPELVGAGAAAACCPWETRLEEAAFVLISWAVFLVAAYLAFVALTALLSPLVALTQGSAIATAVGFTTEMVCVVAECFAWMLKLAVGSAAVGGVVDFVAKFLCGVSPDTSRHKHTTTNHKVGHKA